MGSLIAGIPYRLCLAAQVAPSRNALLFLVLAAAMMPWAFGSILNAARECHEWRGNWCYAVPTAVLLQGQGLGMSGMSDKGNKNAFKTPSHRSPACRTQLRDAASLVSLLSHR